MSGIVLSASVRQNLLSLQSTAELLATTQGRLSSGKKVNSALDNPTNFFTAQGLDNRASDINNLLDGIGNGVQVLQAANTGLTSLQKLVDTAKSIASQVLQTTTGYSPKSTVTSAAALGGTPTNLVDGVTIKAGDVLAIAATGGGTATSITFGANESLAQLNTALAANNLTASLDSANKLVITTSNDAASSTIGAVTYTATGGGTVTFGAVAPPVADSASQTIRASLVAQYNNIITQITTTAQDASFNGINLLNGDNLKLTFNETGKSTLNIAGVTYSAAGLGLSPLVSGTDFLDNSSANATIAKISAASSALRTEASSLGSNLSVVQIRQDFSKNLINVLQTGSANLTVADTNEEAANSQALSTRQSIAVSALSLANQSQQSVLQLLR
ncbi:flagellin [Afipia sp. GAS231]|uniref:flagellin N-terminal helical domain-containing protein n=1 Tax=Afipia sp. GAS231 TaxID=1882747 RepID=UPI00087CA026|nr:flagellin [Afipia sp. GAS231]SDN30899.1 Flagellin FlgL [Afipia sp. GAS231]